MSQSAKVTDASAFKKGSLGVQVLLSVITLGLYTMYWFYITAKQMDNGTNKSLSPILAVIPLLNIIVIWQVSDASEAITNQSKIVLFLLFIFFPPLSWYWIQSGINATASN